MSSSGRNDFGMNAYAPERSAPIAASMVAKPVMSTTSPKGHAARSRAMRSTPLVSGSFTSTIATSNPCVSAMASPSSPRDAVTTSIVLDAALPSESSALIRTAWSVPTSSTLSSMMSRRARPDAAWRRERDATGSPEPEALLEQVVDQLRVRGPLRVLHDLAHEEPEEARLARPELLGLFRIALDHLPTDLVDLAWVAHLLHPELRDHVGRRLVGARDGGVDLLGLLAADLALVDEAEKAGDLPGAHGNLALQAVRLHVAEHLALDEVRDAGGGPTGGVARA